MSQVKVSGNASGTGILTIAAPNTNTDYTLTLPTNTGTVLTSASSIDNSQIAQGPSFYAYRSGSTQSYSTSTWTTAAMQTELYDTHNCYDTSTYAFTPNVAGWYEFYAAVLYDNNTGGRVLFGLLKNSDSNYGGYPSDVTVSGGSPRINGSRIIYMNGTTDFMVLRVWASSSSVLGYCNSANNQDGSWWTGRLIRAA